MSQFFKEPGPSLPWVHASVVKPAIQFLGALGVPTERYLERHRLPENEWNWQRGIIPQRPLLRCVHDIADREGIPNIGQAVRDYIARNAPDWAFAEFPEPTLLASLRSVVRRKVGSSTLRIQENEDSILFCHREDSGLPLEIEAHGGWFTLAGVIELVRNSVGPGWSRCIATVPGTLSEQAWVREAVGTILLESSARNWTLEIPRDCLSLPPWRGWTTCGERSLTGTNVGRNLKFDETVREILKAYLPEGIQRIDEIAEILDTSPRTLQRRLREADSSYRYVLAEARFSLARTMLEETDEKIIEVALHAGYESPSNFTRAFRELAGVTPTQFRDFRNALMLAS